MRKVIFYPLLAAFLIYSAAMLWKYGESYPDISGLYEFAGFVLFAIAPKFVFVVALALSAYGLGGFLFRRWLPEFGSLLEEGLIKTALGLVAISYIVFALGLLGLLYAPAGYGVLAAGIAAGAGDIRRFARQSAGVPRVLRLTVVNVVLLSVSAYFLLKGLYGAFLPPTGFDVLMYHLGVPRMYVDAHAIIPTPDINGSSYPFGIEMLYTLGMMVEGVISANMVNFSFAVMGGLAAAAFTSRFLNGSSGLLAFTMYVSIPMVGWLMPQAYIELAQAAYAMVAVHAVAAASTNDKDKGWFVIAAVLAGFSMSIKYTGIMVVSLLAFWVFLDMLLVEKAGIKRVLGRIGVFFAVAVMVSLPWYAKNIIMFANPVYPYLVDSAGGVGGGIAPLPSGYWSAGPIPVVWSYIRSFWDMTLNATAYWMGWSNGLGPCFLMLIPGILLFGRPRGKLAFLMLFCMAFYLGTFFMGNIRYIAPILPALTVLAAYPVGKLLNEEGRPERIFGHLFLVLIAVGVLQAATPRKAVTSFPPASPRAMDEYYSNGQWSGYLASYDVWNWINQNLPDDAVVYQLWDDASVYFRERNTIGFPLPWGDTSRQRIHHINGVVGFGGYLPAEEMLANLKKMGAGYLLINANREGRTLPDDQYFKDGTQLILSHKGVYLYRLLN